jgi:hypothetical protein
MNSSAIFDRQESLPAARGIGICPIRHVQVLAEPSSGDWRRRTIGASVSAGMITPAKIQVTSFRPVDKLPMAAE